jgi:drug/metabolite transporter (DMT)-like permease
MPARAAGAAAPVLVAVCVMVVWGATPIMTRLALEDLEPLVVATLRTVLAGLLAVPLHRRVREPRRPSPACLGMDHR